MNDSLLRHTRRSLAALAAALILSACGPGTGGTGTGPDYGAVGSAQWFAGAWSQQAQVEASFDAGRIRVRQGCVVVEFDGSWSPSAQGEVQVPVQVLGGISGSLPAQGAQLAATASADQTVRIVVTDGTGRILIGPVELHRQPQGSAVVLPPGC